MPHDLPPRVAAFPLFRALLERRSRRFCKGMELPEGPLAYRSAEEPRKLSLEEEALLAFAACGVSGPALADLSLGVGQGGNIMSGLVGRTIASGDAAQTVAVVVTNDEGAWLLRRPREMGAREVRELVELARDGRFREQYERTRVRIADERIEAPKVPLFNLRVNAWSAGAAGTTTFLPINDLSFLYINGMLDLLNEETGVFVVDDRAAFRPAGLGRFAKSRGGHLWDDPAAGRFATIQRIELLLTEVVTVEQGMVLQNLALATEAMGLAGFPSFAAHELGWFQALGFRMGSMEAVRYLGGSKLLARVTRLVGKGLPIEYPLGLERGGEPLLRCMSPPYFGSMAEAVRFVADQKFGSAGCFRSDAGVTAWKDPEAVRSSVPPISDAAVAATTAYCEYIFRRYGRFPATMAPFRTVLRFQAGHVDCDFYDRHYRSDALGAAHREHEEHWHSGAPG